MPRLSKADEALIDQFDFEIGEPPERERTRTSKHAERFAAARTVAMKVPGKSLKVLTYPQASSAYSQAKAINNGENRLFKDDFQDWKAVAALDPQEGNEKAYSVWLTYEPKGDDTDGE